MKNADSNMPAMNIHLKFTFAGNTILRKSTVRIKNIKAKNNKIYLPKVFLHQLIVALPNFKIILNKISIKEIIHIKIALILNE